MGTTINLDDFSKLDDYDLYGMWDEYLDSDGPVSIAGYEYAVSEALKCTDPTAYRCGFNDWLDGYLEDNEDIIEVDGEYYIKD